MDKNKTSKVTIILMVIVASLMWGTSFLSVKIMLRWLEPIQVLTARWTVAAIFFLILVVLKSFSLPLILVAVIEQAIYINMSISYYTHTTLPFVASIVIGTIQLGATVDYAILMTNRYQRERALGRDKTTAVQTALSTSISSIFTSALGFFAATCGVGLYSDVDLIGSICRLMSRGALISMALVLLLLPSLLLLFDPIIQKTGFGGTLKLKKGEE